MEAATVPTAESNGQPPDSQRSPDELFRFSRFVHVGAGASECEHGEDGQCDAPEHFHAWVRLPNQFQHDDIRKRAQAARARRIRQLRDAESDASVVLDADLEGLRASQDKAPIIDLLLSATVQLDRLSVMRDIESEDEFEHYQADVDRFREILALPEDKQPATERDELRSHMTAYNERVEAKLAELQAPRRSALDGLPLDDLIGQYREQRIAEEGDEAFQSYYSMHEWFACTLRLVADGRPPRERVFADLTELANAAPEIVEALRAAFMGLRVALVRGQTGN